MARHVHLTVGSFEGEGTPNKEKGYLDKPVMLVYQGEFESMDGPVTIKDEDIETLVANHNSFLSKLSRMATGDVPLRHNPPIQLDHSTSARDTVGRLYGNLSVGEHTLEDGTKVKCMMGTARILGADNIERVTDGRWANVSMGADLETHKLTELTITPFPAAAEASMLGARMAAYQGKYKGVEFKVVKDGGGYIFKISGGGESGRVYGEENEAVIAAKKEIDSANLSRLGSPKKESTYRNFTYYVANTGEGTAKPYETGIQWDDGSGWYLEKAFATEAEAVSYAKKMIDKEIAYSPDDYKMSEGKKVPSTKLQKSKTTEVRMGYKDLKEKMAAYEKCKKHLTENQKLSEEDADKKLEAATDDDLTAMSAEHDQELSRMAEADEKAKKDEEAKMANMKGARESFVALSKSMKAGTDKVKLAAKKSSIGVRLARLQSRTKITPAEIKSLNLDEFAKKDDKVIEEVLASYEKREPVIDVGLHGSTKGATPAQMAAHMKKSTFINEELQTRLNMPLKRADALKEVARLSEEAVDKGDKENVDNLSHGKETDEDFEKLWGDVKASLSSGQEDGAKERLKSYLAGYGQKMSTSDAPVGNSTEEMSALADEVKKMQTSFDDIVKLAAPALGIKLEELA